MFRKLLSLLLVLCLLAAIPVSPVLAQEDTLPVIVETYDGENTETTFLSPEESAAMPMPRAAVVYYDTLEEAAEDVRSQLMAGQTPVMVGINRPYEPALVSEIYNLAFVHTGNPKEGDYLSNRCRGYSASMRLSSNRFAITYTPGYATTAEQEAQVDAKVAEILPTIRRDSDYHTILDIFRWLRANVAYQGGDTVQHTAYGALVNGSGVCESYAAAFYRLALECRVDCRIVSGLLIDGDHAWNIVELDGVYYVIDATNDIFLRSEASVERLLVPQTMYDGGVYPGSYPISATDYTADIPYTLENGVLTLPTTNSVTDYYRDVTDLLQQQHLGGIPNPDTFRYSVAPWEGLLGEITSVRLGGSPSFIPSRMFYWNQVIQAVTIPASVKTIENNAFNSCTSMWDVYFTGTQAQWDAITVEEYNNALGWVTVHDNAEPVPEPHIHDYIVSVTVPAGCETEGLYTYACACGECYAKAIPATGHSFADGKCQVCGEADPDYTAPTEPAKQGLQKGEDGNYYYYIDGVVQESFTGLVENSAGSWYIENGQAQMSFDGVIEYEGTKYLIKAGHVNTAYTGLIRIDGGRWLYFAEGVQDTEYVGLVTRAGMQGYVENGQVNFNKSGVVDDNGTLKYVKYGIWRNTFKGLTRTDDGNWLYMVNGAFDATYTGVAKLNSSWMYVENGYVSFNFSGTITVGKYNYTVKYGVVQF